MRTVAGTRRIHLRLPIEVQADFGELCAQMGVSRTALLQALVETALERFADTPFEIASATRTVLRAREIDDERRRRS